MPTIKIAIKVIAGAKENKVAEEVNSDPKLRTFKVKVNQVAQDGKANEKVLELIAEFFGVKKKDVRIASGERSRSKLIEVVTK